MATEKQVELVVRLSVKAGRLDPRNADHLAQCRAQALLLSQVEVTRCIDALNDAIGFSRELSPATDKQREFILDLETNVYGAWKTTPQERLTYSEADARIRLLKKLQAGQTAAPVIDLFSRRAV